MLVEVNQQHIARAEEAREAGLNRSPLHFAVKAKVPYAWFVEEDLLEVRFYDGLGVKAAALTPKAREFVARWTMKRPVTPTAFRLRFVRLPEEEYVLDVYV